MATRVAQLFCFALTSAVLMAAESRPPGFASELNRIVRAGRERFRPIKTFRVDIRPGPLYWYESEVSLPGAEHCRIFEHPRRECICDWAKQNAAQSASFDEMVERVRSAVGAEWTQVNLAKQVPRVARFDPPERVRTPSIEIHEAGLKSEYAVRVTVVAPPPSE